MKLENPPINNQNFNVVDINPSNPSVFKKAFYVVVISLLSKTKKFLNSVKITRFDERLKNLIQRFCSKIEVLYQYSGLFGDVRTYAEARKKRQKIVNDLIEGLKSANTSADIIKILNNPNNVKQIQENDFVRKSFLAAFNNILDLGEDVFEIISNDHETTAKNNQIKASELRSFIRDSDLFEPIVKLCATKRQLDIYDCINNLSKDQLLKLKMQSSLSDLCNSAKEASPDKTVDKNKLTKLFNEALTTHHLEKNEIAKLTHSNIIDVSTLQTDKKYKDGKNILMFFIENNDVAGIQKLIDLHKKSPDSVKIRFNDTDNTGESALFKAARIGNPEILKKLIELNNIIPENNKIDVNKTISQKKYTALHAAIRYDNHEFVKILLENFPETDIEARITGEKYTPLIFAILKDHSLESVELLVKAGADINAADIFGKTAIFYAAQGGDAKVLDALKDADINIIAHNGDTPLHRAMFANSTNFITYIKKYNKKFQNINKKDIIGYSPLRYAVQLRKDEMIKSLSDLSLDIDFNLTDNDNKTLFEVSEKKDDIYKTNITEALNYLKNSMSATKNTQVKN